MKKQLEHDVLIAGGGVVGLSAALGLAKHFPQLSIGVVEAFKKNSSQDSSVAKHPSFDARVIALAKYSFQSLKSFGIPLDKLDACPIHHIHVSDRGHIGQAKLSFESRDSGGNNSGGKSGGDIKGNSSFDELGYVVSLDDLGQLLSAQLEDAPNITMYQPEKIQSLRQTDADIFCETDNFELSAKLLLVAEGADSHTKQLLGINNVIDDYGQSAIISNVQCQLAHNNQAFERFTSQGPLALLPMNGGDGKQMSMVWTLNNEKLDTVMNLSSKAFLTKLQSLFSDRLGRIERHSTRFAYPLKLSLARPFVKHRAICIGNAAQSLHPIAGQGFNLGIRDIDALLSSIYHLSADQKSADQKSAAQISASQTQANFELGSYQHLKVYKTLRESDKHMTITATDSLVRIFSNQYFPSVVGRNLGLMALNHASALKQSFAQFAMGARK